MGGRGSGNWHRPVSHQLIDSMPEIHVSCLLGTGGDIAAITRDELERGLQLFHYIRNGNVVLLFSKGTGDDSEGSVAITVESTQCHLGGVRYWLRCPGEDCGRRVQSLFVSKNRSIGCRHCLGLRYAAQYGGEVELALGRLRKYQRSVGRGEQNRPIDMAKMYELFRDVLSPLEKIAHGDS